MATVQEGKLNIRKIVDANKGLQDKLAKFAPNEKVLEEEEEKKSLESKDGEEVRKELRRRDAFNSQQTKNETEEEDDEKEVTETNGNHIPEKGKKVKGFYRQTIADRRKAEQKASELEEKVKKYEEEELPALTQKIKELEELRESATGNQESDITKRIEELEREKEEATQFSSKAQETIDQLQSRLGFFDFQESPQFKQKFVEPMAKTYKSLVMYIGNDPDHQKLIARIGQANSAVLSAPNEQLRVAAERDRDEMVSQFLEVMPEFKRYKLGGMFNDLFEKSISHAEALANWQNERQRIQQESLEHQRSATLNRQKYWSGLYEDVGKGLDNQFDDDEELKRIIEENKLNGDTSHDDKIARGALSENSGIPDRELVRVLHQGRVYGRVATENKALKIMVKQLREELGKYKGIDRTTAGEQREASPEKVKVGRDEKYRDWLKTFQAR